MRASANCVSPMQLTRKWWQENSNVERLRLLVKERLKWTRNLGQVFKWDTV